MNAMHVASLLFLGLTGYVLASLLFPEWFE